MTRTTAGRAVGALYLLAFVVYIAGSALVDAGSATADVLTGAAERQHQLPAGALLMLLNSVAVAGIGILAFPVLRAHSEVSALAFLIGRTIEAVLLTVGILFLLMLVPLSRENTAAGVDPTSGLPALARTALEGNQYAYQLAMIAVGVSGMILCRVLWQARLAPRLLAGWGLIGYAVFLVGAVLEVLGVGAGLVLSIPGGLFEIALGVLLVRRGFPGEQASVPDGDRSDPHLSPAPIP